MMRSVVPYFYCLGRQVRKNGCTQRAVMINVVEQKVEEHWRTVSLPKAQLEEIRSMVWGHVAKVLPRRDRAIEQAKRALARLDDQSEKLLQAHYNDAISMDLLRREQSRIAAERAAAEKTLAENAVRREQVKANLQQALSLLETPRRNTSARRAASDDK